MVKKRQTIKLSRIGASTGEITLFTNTTSEPSFTPSFVPLSEDYASSFNFTPSIWAQTVPGVDPDGTTWKSVITVNSIAGASWPVGYDTTVIIEIHGNISGDRLLSSFKIIMEADAATFTASPAVIELSYD